MHDVKVRYFIRYLYMHGDVAEEVSSLEVHSLTAKVPRKEGAVGYKIYSCKVITQYGEEFSTEVKPFKGMVYWGTEIAIDEAKKWASGMLLHTMQNEKWHSIVKVGDVILPVLKDDRVIEV